ncbi:Structural maintenance of chromosomes protein 3 [Gonapodya sp. JEL0774]|nr:Structural maintenance of chromosomes protein 3 [Gonapodya sp. JEL0774]
MADERYNSLAVSFLFPNRFVNDPISFSPRPFSQSQLCTPISEIQRRGVTFRDFACIARNNGLNVLAKPGDTTSYAEFMKDIELSATSPDVHLVVSFSRKAMGCTGDGHFSPIGAYHRGEDKALVLDVARFKYPSYFASTKELYEAMKPVDKETGLSRGYFLLRRGTRKHAPLCKVAVHPSANRADLSTLLTRSVPSYLASLVPRTLEDVVRAVLAAIPDDYRFLVSMQAPGVDLAGGDEQRKGVLERHKRMVDELVEEARNNGMFQVVANVAGGGMMFNDRHGKGEGMDTAGDSTFTPQVEQAFCSHGAPQVCCSWCVDFSQGAYKEGNNRAYVGSAARDRRVALATIFMLASPRDMYQSLPAHLSDQLEEFRRSVETGGRGGRLLREEVTISGFKSYKNQTTLEEFDPGHNVIGDVTTPGAAFDRKSLLLGPFSLNLSALRVVGRNGSGKSNFFWAIRYVLGDAYQNMTKEERQQLLHEGAGNTTLNAYVEIVFDNSDGRFLGGKEEVILRRTIGMKKDDYHLDKKSVTRAEVNNLLESAGFSKANPFYIVPQGRVQALTNAKDSERLKVLKDVAGTRTYEERREASLKIMAETDLKRKKIDELIDGIQERLAELEEEKEELREFQDKDKERRALEFTIYQRELDELAAQLSQLDEERVRKSQESEGVQRGFALRDKRMIVIDREIRELNNQLALLSTEKAEIEGDKEEAIRSKASAEMVVKDLEAANSGNERQKAELNSEIKALDTKIGAKQREFEKVLPQYQSGLQKEQQLEAHVREVEVQRNALFEKRGRSEQFQTKNERDKWIKDEIAKIKRAAEEQGKQAKSLASDIVDTKKQIATLNEEIEETVTRMQGRKQRLAEIDRRVQVLKEERDGKTEERKNIWREAEKAKANQSSNKVEMEKAERDLMSMMDHNTRAGIKSVRQIAQRLKLSGVYGCLYELIELQDKYRIAVETVAGNSLFHVVVDTDATATRILEEMKRNPQSGRVTFIPLGQIRAREHRELPASKDSIPMMKRLTFDPKFQRAVEQVFGKAIVVPTLDVGAKYAKDEKLTAVTMDGDRAERKGALTGGYIDMRRSRLESAHSAKVYRVEYEKATRTVNESAEKAEVMSQEVVQLTNEINALELERRSLTGNTDPLAKEVSTKTNQERKLSERLEAQEKTHHEVEANLKQLQTQIVEYQKWLASPMTSKLSLEEQSKLEALNKDKEALEKQLLESQEARMNLEAQRNVLSIEIESFKDRRALVVGQLDRLQTGGDMSSAPGGGDLKSRKQELARYTKEVDTASAKLAAVEKEVERLSSLLAQKTNALEQEQAEYQNEERNLEKARNELKKFSGRRATLLARKEEWMKKLRDLGVPPDDALEIYQSTPSSKVGVHLNKRLATVREALKKFDHVNKKALDQYNNFTSQRDQLLERKEELDKSAEAIEDLIKVLDQRKDAAIERSFREVKQYFSEIFEKLEPKGRGELVMIAKGDDSQTQDMDEDEDETRDKSSVDRYVGIGIRVSFNSKRDEALMNEQLSGGQKSLVALALIFAIQRSDPAPFYLFDEIDANLDPMYRTAVANMIKELCTEGTAQFITTTFRPEQLQVANKFYGVTFINKVSSIQLITKEDAVNFVEQEQAV